MSNKPSILTKLKAKYMLLFRKIWYAYILPHKLDPQLVPLSWHYELQYEMLDDNAQSIVNDRIELLHKIGCQVKVTQPKSNIPAEYFARVSCWNGAILEYQMYLQKQVVNVEKTNIVSVPIYQLSHSIPPTACNNNLNPCF